MKIHPNECGLIVDMATGQIIIDPSHPEGEKQLTYLFRFMSNRERGDDIRAIKELLRTREQFMAVHDELAHTINAEIDGMRETDPQLFDHNGDLDPEMVMGIKKETIH